MLWRVRTTLPDRPGALATLARECGRAGVNIVGLQVFPAGEDVTDELVLRTPDGWGEAALDALLQRSGGHDVHARRCAEEALADQPTRYVDACRAVLDQPASFPDVVAHLFDADVHPDGDDQDVMVMTVGDVQVHIRREAPFTPVERARGAAMAALVSDVLNRERPVVPRSPSRRLGGADHAPEYVVGEDTVTALVDGVAVGVAQVGPEPPGDAAHRAIDVTVDTGYQRRGIGTRLLGDVARLARRLGAEEVVLTTAHDNRAVMPMVLAAGMRGRIRMAGETLTVRISVAEL